MFNNSAIGGVSNGLYYLERILDIIIKFFAALTGGSSSTTTTTTTAAADEAE